MRIAKLWVLAFTIILSSMITFECVALAVKTSSFSLSLPDEMQEVLKNEDQSQGIFQYVYQTKSNADLGLTQLRVTKIENVPAKNQDIEAFELETLGAMIAIFAKAHQLSLDNQQKSLSQKPDPLKLGSNTYKSVRMLFKHLEVEFLVTVIGNTTYTFFLVTEGNDAVKRKSNLELLRSKISDIQYY